MKTSVEDAFCSSTEYEVNLERFSGNILYQYPGKIFTMGMYSGNLLILNL